MIIKLLPPWILSTDHDEDSMTRPCDCGSGEYSEWIFDGHGIELCRCCDHCRAQKLAQYRPDILDDYDCDEDIEPDDESPGPDQLPCMCPTEE